MGAPGRRDGAEPPSRARRRDPASRFSLWLGDRRIPVDGQGRAGFGYGGAGVFPPAVGVRSLLEGRGPELEDRFVVIAQTTAACRHDFPARVPNPYGGTMSQTELVAGVAADLLDGRLFVHRDGSRILLLLGIPCVAGFLALRRRLPWLAVSVAPAAGLPVVASYGAFRFGVLADPVPAVLLVLLAGVSLSVATTRQQRREKQRVEAQFSRYVSSQVLDVILRERAAVTTAGERRTVTVLFSDIRNFTALSDTRDPAVVAALLNAYLEARVGCLQRHGATIDKFIGDGILADFGAPIDQPDHAERAVRSALAMLDTLPEVRERWRASGVDELAIGIGIHTGPVGVGTIGAEQRAEYTVIGDTVNTASRIEGLTKGCGAPLLVSEATLARLPAGFESRFVNEVRLKGKEGLTRVYAVERGPGNG